MVLGLVHLADHRTIHSPPSMAVLWIFESTASHFLVFILYLLRPHHITSRLDFLVNLEIYR